MAVLTARERRRIPKSKFAVPSKTKGGKDRYPVNDIAHARAALRLINRGHDLTAANKASIRRKATKMLYGKAASTESGVKKLQQQKGRKR